MSESTYEPRASRLAHQQNQWQEVCVVLDDSSRFILAGGEFAIATAEISIGLVRKELEDNGKVRRIREVFTDHGTQFFANSCIKMVNLKVHSVLSWPKMELLISWQG